MTEKSPSSDNWAAWAAFWIGLALVVDCVLGALATWQARQYPGLTAGFIFLVAAAVLVVVYRWLRPSVGRFWWILLCLALLLYFVSLAYQADAAKETGWRDSWTAAGLPDSIGGGTLEIAYPSPILWDAPDQPGVPLSVFVWPPSPSDPSKRSDSLRVATMMPVTSTVSPDASGSLTETQALAASLVPSYTIGFLPYDDSLLFVNEKGIPIAPSVVITRSMPMDKPAVLYLRRARRTPGTTSLSVLVRLFEAGGGIPPLLTTIEIGLEDGYGAWWRHFVHHALGPTTPLLALAAALVGFAWQSSQESRQKRQECLDEISGLYTTVIDKPSEAVLLWWEYRERTERQAEWRDSEVKAGLGRAWEHIKNYRWQDAILKRAADQLEEHPRAAQKIAGIVLDLDPENCIAGDMKELAEWAAKKGESAQWPGASIDASEVANVLVRVYTAFNQCLPVCVDIASGLLSKPEPAKTVSERLTASPDGRQLLKRLEFGDVLKKLEGNKDEAVREVATGLSRQREERYRWPPLWPKLRLEGSESLQKWLKESNLEWNPFGPELAELDRRLTEFYVQPSWFGLMGQPLAGMLFGEPGSGRTATALLLAHACTHPPANPRYEHTFPAYQQLSLVAVSEESSGSLAWLTSMLGRALTRFLALNPYAFCEQSKEGQAAMKELLVRCAGSAAIAAQRLTRAGLKAEGGGAALVQEIGDFGDQVSAQTPIHQEELVDLAAQAKPHGFTATYALVDMASFGAQGEPLQKVAGWLQPLLELAVPLAGANLYLKVFLPQELQQSLRAPEGVTSTNISWQTDELKTLLEERLRKAGTNTLAELCDAQARLPDPDGRLVRAAQGSPRLLVRFGNRLLQRAASRSMQARLEKSDLDEVLGPA